MSAIALSTWGKYQAPTPFFGEATTPHPVTKTQVRHAMRINSPRLAVWIFDSHPATSTSIEKS